MAFDAGAIESQLRVSLTDFNRDLDQAEARLDGIEKARTIPLHVQLDPQESARLRRQLADMDRQLTQDMQQRASSQGSLLGTISGLSTTGGARQQAQQQNQAMQTFMQRLQAQSGINVGGGSRGGGGGSSFTSQGVADFHRNLLQGIGPQILGLGLKTTAIAGLGSALAGGLPTAAAGAGVLGVGGLGLGVAAAGTKALIGTKQDQGPLFAQAQQVQQSLETAFKNAAGPLTNIMRGIFAQIPGFLRQITPELQQVFASLGPLVKGTFAGLETVAKEVLPLLAGAFKAVGPLMQPLIDGLGKLLTGLLPGLISLLRAAKPAIDVIAQVLGILGRNIGAMLTTFVPVIRDSAVVFKALSQVIASIFPIVGQLSAIFARTLAPVFATLATIIRNLLPFLTIIGRIFAQLASAILGDLVAALGALAGLLKDITPSLNILAQMLGRVFTIMENSGVFALLGDVLEKLTRPLATLINALVSGLAPVLPGILTLVARLANTAIAVLATAIEQLLPPITKLVTILLSSLQPVFPVIERALALLAGALGATLLTAIKVITPTLNVLVSILKTISPALPTIVEGILALTAAIKVWEIAQAAINILLDANPIGIVIAAIAALVVGVIYAWTHFRTFRVVVETVWNAIKTATTDVVNFIRDNWRLLLVVLANILTGGLSTIVLLIVTHWHKIENAYDDGRHEVASIWDALWQDTVGSVIRFTGQIINHLQGWWDAVVNGFKLAVQGIEGFWDRIYSIVKVPVNFLIGTVYDDGIRRLWNDVVAKIPGVPSLPSVQKLAGGGRLGGYGGGDILPALLEPGETVISKEDSRHPAAQALFSMLGVPGFQGGGGTGQGPGGRVGQLDPGFNPHGHGNAFSFLGSLGSIVAALFTGNTSVLVNDLLKFAHLPASLASGPLRDLVLGIPKSIIHHLVELVKGLGSPSLPGHAGQLGLPGGTATPGLISIASFLMAHGASRAAAAGAAGTIAGESGGDPESVGSGGAGIIGWTPPTPPHVFPLFPIVTGNPGRDMAVQLVDLLAWIERYGSIAQMNSAAATGGLVGAAWNWSNRYEGPLVPGSDIRMDVVKQLYARGFDSGGWLTPYGPMGFNTGRRPEAVLTPGQSDGFVDIAEAARLFRTRGHALSQAGVAGLMRDVYLQLPEGTTVAQALAELRFQLTHASMQNYANVSP